MRRAPAISVLLAIAFSLIGPLASAETESRLPACCRRNGAHHCMQPDGKSAPGTVFQATGEKCPVSPVTAAPAIRASAVLGRNTAFIFAGLVSHPSIHFQTEARSRVSFSRSRLKRGPPTLLS